MALGSKILPVAAVAGMVFLLVIALPRASLGSADRFLMARSPKAHAGTLQELRPLILKEAEAAGVDPCLVGAILAVEQQNRKPLRRMLEAVVAKQQFVVSKVLGGDLPDQSLGVGQIRISTALWVNTNFQARASLRDQELLGGLRLIDSLADDRENIRVLAQYARYLQRRRDPHAKRSVHVEDPASAAVLATEYHHGLLPLGKVRPKLYGDLVGALVKSKQFTELFGH